MNWTAVTAPLSSNKLQLCNIIVNKCGNLLIKRNVTNYPILLCFVSGRWNLAKFSSWNQYYLQTTKCPEVLFSYSKMTWMLSHSHELTQQAGRAKNMVKPCVSSVTIIILFRKNCLKLHLPLNRSDNINFRKIMTEHASNRPVTFVTHKHFAVLFFLQSCCVNSLLMFVDTEKEKMSFWAEVKKLDSGYYWQQ